MATSPSRRVFIVFNPRSGRGRAAEALRPLAAELKARGFEPVDRPIDKGLPTESELRTVAAVVVAGGDGTVAAVSEQAAAAGTAIYHFPAGTENLFARENAMGGRPAQVAAWIAQGASRQLDLASFACGGARRPMVLMLSAGPDAGVVKRLAAARTGAITKASYVSHTLRELVTPTLPEITIEADGKSLVERKRGMVIVANCGRYGGGFDPAGDAVMNDGLLDVAFFPLGSAASWVWAMLMCKAGWRGSLPGVITARAKAVKVGLPTGGAVQADGEHIWAGAEPLQVLLEVKPLALRVCAAPNGA
ncbi:MAG: diacylglycerol/lipid kinase family protein [Phycisphaerales bacterium]